ncbi:hypothetical protein ABT167_20755 [Streptomyces sp. NPDC001792]|uniref:hypothetical protein n=1 Tax=Streptomyces sp. NPDC001792 TaxID=3154524 RepID=UPI00331FC203
MARGGALGGRHLNSALVCPGCGACAPDIAPHAAAEVEDPPPARQGRPGRRRKNRRRAVVAGVVALVGGGLTVGMVDRHPTDRAQAAVAPGDRRTGAGQEQTPDKDHPATAPATAPHTHRPSRTPSQPPTAADALPSHPSTAKDTEARCRAYERIKGRGHALDAPAWQRLVHAADGERQVPGYCAQLTGPAHDATPAPATTDKAKKTGRATNTGKAGKGQGRPSAEPRPSKGPGSSGNQP